MTKRSKSVSFSASSELYDAIEIMAYSDKTSIAEVVRKIVAKEMVEYSLLDPRAATTERNATINSYHRPKAERRALRLEATA